MPEADDQSIFGNEPPNKEDDNQPNNDNPYAEKLGAIRDADGRVKYTTVEAALDALPHANAHIANMERERAEERAELARIQEELSRAKGALETYQKFTPNNEPAEPQQPEPQVPQGPSQDDIVNLVDTRLEAQRIADARKENESAVVGKLTEVYGDKAAEAFNQKAQELDMSIDEMNEMARTNPKAVMALFPTDKPATGGAPITTNFHINDSNKPPQNGPLEAPEKSVLFMSTDQDQLSEWRRHGEFVQQQNQ